MRIAYDVSFYGIAHRNPNDRTGIYRVVENILLGLIKERIDLNLYAARDLADAISYMKEHAVLRNLPLPETLAQKDEKQIALKAKIEEIFVNRTIARLIWKLFKKLGFIRQESHGLYPESLLESQIYHSPFLGIPENIRFYKHLHCFLTVYDLIPILLPEYVNQQATSWTKEAILSLRKDDWVFSISQATKNDLCEFNKNINPEKVIVNHLAAAPELFYPCQDFSQIREVKKKYNIPEDVVYMLSLGNIAPHKNFKHLVRSFDMLLQQESVSSLYLVVVGSFTWQYEALFEEINTRQLLKEKVLFTGRVADEDLSALYSGSLGFVYMSLYEGFGLPPLEAMQCGVPVVTSNTSSLPEVVGTAGVLLDPRDADGLCQAMLDLYRDAGLRRRMGQGSLAQAARFSWDKCVRQTTEAYRGAISSTASTL